MLPKHLTLSATKFIYMPPSALAGTPGRYTITRCDQPASSPRYIYPCFKFSIISNKKKKWRSILNICGIRMWKSSRPLRSVCEFIEYHYSLVLVWSDIWKYLRYWVKNSSAQFGAERPRQPVFSWVVVNWYIRVSEPYGRDDYTDIYFDVIFILYLYFSLFSILDYLILIIPLLFISYLFRS